MFRKIFLSVLIIMKKNLMSLLKNKYVYYAVVLFSVVNVLGYFSMRSWECIVMFSAVAYSANCYAKNVTVALLAGLFVSNFIFGCNRVKEGFEEKMSGVEGLLERAENMLEKVQNMNPSGEGFTEGKRNKVKKLTAEAKAKLEAARKACEDKGPNHQFNETTQECKAL